MICSRRLLFVQLSLILCVTSGYPSFLLLLPPIYLHLTPTSFLNKTTLPYLILVVYRTCLFA